MGFLGTTSPNDYYSQGEAENFPTGFGNYQFIALKTIINNFMYIYVGENKIITKVNRTDVQFHAIRALQELSYDVLRSFKSQEIEIPNTLKMPLPQDYVNYIKLTKVGDDGIERVLYPTSKTSNPFAITQNADGTYNAGFDKRKITVTFSGITGNVSVLDEKFLTLGYTTSTGTQGLVHFRFEANAGDLNEYNFPTGQGPVFGISTDVSMTETTAATKLMEYIHDFGHHTVTQNNGVLTITYNEDLNNSATVIGTENIYQGSGATYSGNLTLAVVTPGTTSSTTALQEQVPSNTLDNFSDTTQSDPDSDDSTDIEIDYRGRRYGLDPQHAQSNGTFYIDNLRGHIHFGSSLAGETIILKYVSDGAGTDDEMVVHKFCEEACYKWIMYGVLSGRSNIPEYLVQRFKKEKFAETRKAKIRLSNIKIEEFTQVLKGMSKQIK